MIAMDGSGIEPELMFEENNAVEFADYQFEYGFCRYVYRKEMLERCQVRFLALRRFQDVPFLVEVMHYARRFYAMHRPVYGLRTGHHEIDWAADGCAKGCDNARGLAIVYSMAVQYGYKRMADRVMGRLVEFVGWLGADIRGLRERVRQLETETSSKAYRFGVALAWPIRTVRRLVGRDG